MAKIKIIWEIIPKFYYLHSNLYKNTLTLNFNNFFKFYANWKSNPIRWKRRTWNTILSAYCFNKYHNLKVVNFLFPLFPLQCSITCLIFIIPNCSTAHLIFFSCDFTAAAPSNLVILLIFTVLIKTWPYSAHKYILIIAKFLLRWLIFLIWCIISILIKCLKIYLCQLLPNKV